VNGHGRAVLEPKWLRTSGYGPTQSMAMHSKSNGRRPTQSIGVLLMDPGVLFKGKGPGKEIGYFFLLDIRHIRIRNATKR